MNSDVGDVPGETKPVVLTYVDAPPGAGLRLHHMMFIVGVCAVVMWLAVILGAWFVALVLVLLVASAVGLVIVLFRRSVAQKESLLWSLAIAADRSMPLADAVLAFADQYRWIYRRRVQLLAALLNEGLTLPDAAGQVPGALSREAEVMVRVGDASGTLARSLREAAALRTNRESAWGATALRFFYLGALLLAMQTVTTFIMYFIIPKFEAIFQDFGVSLPPVTILTIHISHVFIKYGFVVVPLLFVIEVVVPLALLVGMLNSYGLWMDIPVLDYLFRRRHSALILRALALAVEGRKPIGQAIEVLRRDYPSAWARDRLSRVDDDVRKGRDWIESLRDAGLIRPAEAAVLDSAQRVGNLEWALRAAAEVTARRLGYRLKFWLQMFFPVLIVALGGVVFLFAVAYFSPLVRLIEALAG